MNIKQVLEGWRNNTIPPSHLKELISETAKERIKICLECQYHSKYHHTLRPDSHCVNCGCTLSAKTKCLSCECPISKWKAVATDEQDDQIKDIINGKETRT
jgi:hypothetical protein